MSNEPKWELLRAFLAVCRGGSFHRASELLGMKRTTVANAISQLEEELNLVLFERTARGCVMTAAADSLLPSVEAMDGAAGQFGKLASAAQGASGGDVILSVPDGLALAVIVPALEPFLDSNPDINVILECGLWIPETGRLMPDIAISYERPTHPNAVAKSLCHIHYTLFASERYIAKNGLPSTLAEVTAHRFVGHTAQVHQKEKWSDKANAFETLVEPQIISNSSAVTLESLRQGVGINAAPSFVIDLYPELVPLPVGALTDPAHLFMCTDKSVRRAPSVEKTKSWLEGLFDPATNRWLRETYEDPYEHWKKQNPRWSKGSKIVSLNTAKKNTQ